jgi:hypothetical protein
LFYTAVGGMSAFFVAWCGVAIVMWIDAIRARRRTGRG